jgi:hypothetical protein
MILSIYNYQDSPPINQTTVLIQAKTHKRNNKIYHSPCFKIADQNVIESVQRRRPKQRRMARNRLGRRRSRCSAPVGSPHVLWGGGLVTTPRTPWRLARLLYGWTTVYIYTFAAHVQIQRDSAQDVAVYSNTKYIPDGSPEKTRVNFTKLSISCYDGTWR